MRQTKNLVLGTGLKRCHPKSPTILRKYANSSPSHNSQIRSFHHPLLRCSRKSRAAWTCECILSPPTSAPLRSYIKKKVFPIWRRQNLVLMPLENVITIRRSSKCIVTLSVPPMSTYGRSSKETPTGLSSFNANQVVNQSLLC